jgi:hypothetical protein
MRRMTGRARNTWVLVLLATPALVGFTPGVAPADPAASAPAPATASPRPDAAGLDAARLETLVGQILYAARPTTVRTRGSGNIAVDLPRGRALRFTGLSAAEVFLEPSPPDADLLRQFGVRKIPVYKLPRAQLAEDFVTAAAWEEMRTGGLRRLRDRWPALDDDRLLRILTGEPFLGMTLEQAEEAVGATVFFRETRGTPDGPEEVWTIGRRSRLAEQRAFMEGRDKGIRAATFDDYLRIKTRLILRFRNGVLAAIDTPSAR